MLERSYWSREIADLLQISDSTLRKWCLLLEKEGYKFLRDDKNNRAFTDHDVIALRKFQELTKDKHVTLENATTIVVSMYSERAVTLPVMPKEDRYEERFAEMEKQLNQLIQYNEKQDAFNRALIEKLDQRNDQLNEFIQIYRQQLEAPKEKKKWYQFWIREEDER